MAMRGIAWRSGEIGFIRLWQDLARAWPIPFESASTSPHGALMVPAGVLVLAWSLCGRPSPSVALSCHLQTDAKCMAAIHS